MMPAIRPDLKLRAAAVAVICAAASPAFAADPPGKGITMYMQMGGNPGDGATLARQTGAAAAAQALGLDSLNEQFSGWAPEKMIEQFKQALAASRPASRSWAIPATRRSWTWSSRRSTRASR